MIIACTIFVFGLIDDLTTLPIEIEYLSTLPIVQVAAGVNHFVALTAGGQIFCWGKNTNGQTGQEPSENYNWYPKRVANLTKVVYIACGSKHTAAVTKNGFIFTFGTNSHGQLGETNKTDRYLPKAVTEMLGTPVSNVSCGR